jgi:hypothetical protein
MAKNKIQFQKAIALRICLKNMARKNNVRMLYSNGAGLISSAVQNVAQTAIVA